MHLNIFILLFSLKSKSSLRVWCNMQRNIPATSYTNIQRAMVQAYRICILIFFLTAVFLRTEAQGFLQSLNGKTDTNYIESYLDHLTARTYASVKSATISLGDERNGFQLDYKPNSPLILGIGANYGILGLNIGFNFPFINNDDHKYGKTDYLDLQTHIYLRPLVLDIYAQYYKGYNQRDPNDWYTDWPQYDTLPMRSDLQSISIGLNGQYIFNNKKFSYRAAFVQNEWQKKSAGSFLAGGNIFFVDTQGDSSLVPPGGPDSSFFEGLHFSQYRFINGSLIAGYAHTFVVKQHFFLTMSLVGGLGGGGSWAYTSEEAEVDRSGFTLAGNFSGRVAAGYNSRKVYVGVSYLGILIRNQSPVPKTWLGYNTGMFRFNLVYRFRLKKDLRILAR